MQQIPLPKTLPLPLPKSKELNKELHKELHKKLPLPLPIIDFNIAVLLFIYDINMSNYFKTKIDKLIDKYSENNIHLYIGIKTFENRYIVNINVNDYLNNIFKYKNKKIFLFDTEQNSKGGDIGGYIQLSKIASELGTYKWYVIFQTKTNLKWRNDLILPILNLDFLTISDNIGIIGSKKWTMNFFLNKNSSYNYHFKKLNEIFNISWDEFSKINSWEFVGGSMFVLNNKIINYMNNYNNDIYNLLNTNTSIDINWVNHLEKTKLNRKNCNNDYEHRIKYKKSLISDYMIEHTFERYIGFIVKYLKMNTKKIM